jgi:TM2 domain-containing membrane protein YozV
MFSLTIENLWANENSIMTSIDSSSDFSSQLLIQNESEKEIDKQKSPSKSTAFFLSFILPGAGEYYLGSTKMAKIFFGIEATLWATFLTLKTYGSWKEKDYQLYAISHAGINTSGKEYQYYIDIENYNNIQEYNDAKLRTRDIGALYENNDEYSWNWDSEKSRNKFKKLRISSDTAYQSALFVIGGIVMNHLISGIDAVRIVRKQEKLKNNGIKIGFVPMPEGGGRLVLFKCF